MVLRMAKVLGIKWLIAVEDLNIKGLSRGILVGPVHDAGWNSFFAKLATKGVFWACGPRDLAFEVPHVGVEHIGVDLIDEANRGWELIHELAENVLVVFVCGVGLLAVFLVEESFHRGTN